MKRCGQSEKCIFAKMVVRPDESLDGSPATGVACGMSRSDGRSLNQLRPIRFIPHVAPSAAGSVLVCFGDTRVICAVMVEEDVPRWMKVQGVKGGWLSAEYAMLPYSTLERKQRDITRGKLDGRSTEIQRLIGRALRAVVDLKKLGQRTLWIDCDVLQADGGTRTAAITGAAVAVAIALRGLKAQGKLKDNPLRGLIAAVSCGIVDGKATLDLNYVEDRDAAVDFNVVMTETGEFVELQGSGEEAVFTAQQMQDMLALAAEGVKQLNALQHAALNEADRPDARDLLDLAAVFGKK